MGTVTNIHERLIKAPAEAIGPLMDRLGGPDDVLWPSPAWNPMILDGPMTVGTRGGHGGVRYRVSAFEPGRRVRFDFHPDLGLDGYHEATVTAVDAHRCILRHVIIAQPRGAMRLLWPLAVRWLHDAVLEDLLDNAESAAAQSMGAPPPAGRRWSLPVRLLRTLEHADAARAVSLPEDARLARAAFPTSEDGADPVDFADAFQVARPRGAPSDPAMWADAIFFDPPRWVWALLRLRNVLVRAIGIEPGDESAFATLALSDDEVLLGTDAGHLDFRASIFIAAQTVTLSTLVRINNRRGRLYMAVVRRIHPVVVRSMLTRAARRLANHPTVPAPTR